MSQLIAAYWRHARTYYRHPDGTPTSEVDTIKQALKPVRQLYGSTTAVQFGPRCLEAVREAMIQKGWSRTYINKQIHRVRGLFRWGTSKELVPPNVLEALRSVKALRSGRTEARETDPVRPVPEAHVQAIRPYVARQVWGLIELMLLTGARAGELVRLRSVDIDMSRAVWMAHLSQHKCAHHGTVRTIYFGPRAQLVLREFLVGGSVDACLFSPLQAEAERHVRAQTHRRPDQQPNPRKTTRTVGACYTVASFRRAIHRACDKAGVPRWSPHRLRHSAATNIRREFGIEVARVILGHASLDATSVYAEFDQQRAGQVIAKIG